MYSFSFVQHPIRLLIQDHSRIFLGANKLIAIYCSNQAGNIESIVKNEGSEELLNISQVTSSIDELRSGLVDFVWMEESSLPFKVKQKGIYQKEIFDEINKTVLMVRVPSEYDEKSDLLFLYFDKNLSSVTLSENKSITLKGDTKSVIAYTIFNSILSIVSDAKGNKEALVQQYTPATQAIIESNKSLNLRLKNYESNSNNAFIKIYKSLFDRYIGTTTCTITFSNLAISKLTELSSEIDKLELVIKNTVAYLQTLYLHELPPVLEIEDYHINSNIFKEEHSKAADRYSKTISLLDGLNEAVKLVMVQNQNPTGKSVGAAMAKPVSAPAISDALKNHKSKILSLLDQYPNRWTDLRQFFKPLQNISLSSSYYKRMSV